MGIWRWANILSLANALTGVGAVFVASSGDPPLAARLLSLALLFDALDGPIARRQGPTPEGRLLDRVCDRISQTIAPAVLFVVYSSFHPVAFLLGLALVLAGLLRLLGSDPLGDRPNPGFPLYPGALVVVSGILLALPWKPLAAMLAVGVILSLSEVRSALPAALKRTAASWSGWKRTLLEAGRALPLLLIALPFSPIFEIASWLTFAAMGLLLLRGAALDAARRLGIGDL